MIEFTNKNFEKAEKSKKPESYETRDPLSSVYYKCVGENLESLQNTWDETYQESYGYLRQYAINVIEKYLKCGDFHYGFARIQCYDCNQEYLLPFSCKRRYFCPSCHQKRVIEFGEHLCNEVLKDVPHRHVVFSIPKRLRIYFQFDRKLLSKLSKCASTVLTNFLQESVTTNSIPTSTATSTATSTSIPGIVIAVQTFGDFLNFNPHLHILSTDGCFCANNFIQSPSGIYSKQNIQKLELAFANEVLKMLQKEGKITESIVQNILSWKHSGFNIHFGESIDSEDEKSLERLAQYIVRAPISQERMMYLSSKDSDDKNAKVIYTSKSGDTKEVFTALDWLARMVTHIPNKGEQLVRYYGFYSNKSRGMRKKSECSECDEDIKIIPSKVSSNAFKKNWARLIQKIYNVDPLECKKCKGKMRIVCFVEKTSEIEKVLKNLNIQQSDNPNNTNMPNAPPFTDNNTDNKKFTLNENLKKKIEYMNKLAKKLEESNIDNRNNYSANTQNNFFGTNNSAPIISDLTSDNVMPNYEDIIEPLPDYYD